MGIINAFVAQQREADRQSRIKQGLQRIDGAFSGFGDNYYRDYADANTSYYMPQVEDQYLDAQKELTYRLARAGTLNSSMASTNTADLAKQNARNRASILQQSDQAAANLRNRVSAEKSNLAQQLYATENPDLTANAALTSAKSIGADQPSMSPLSSLFNVATIGAGQFMNGFKSGNAYTQAFGGTPGGGGFTSSGRTIS